MEGTINDNYLNPVGAVSTPEDALAKMKKNIWVNLDDVEMNDNVNQIHCDTRDFHCLVKEELIDIKDGRAPEIRKAVHKMEYQIPETEVIGWLNSIRDISGGKESKWRFLSFNNVGKDEIWMKYLRLYRNPKKKGFFIVCEQQDIPVQWKEFNEENLNKELLNAY